MISNSIQQQMKEAIQEEIAPLTSRLNNIESDQATSAENTKKNMDSLDRKFDQIIKLLSSTQKSSSSGGDPHS
jgi:Zn-dependent oligopeptidase